MHVWVIKLTHTKMRILPEPATGQPILLLAQISPLIFKHPRLSDIKILHINVIMIIYEVIGL